MARHAFILGGTGQIGYATAQHLLHNGWRVTLASRGQRAAPANLTSVGAHVVRVDRDQPGALGKALAGGADVVIDALAYEARITCILNAGDPQAIGVAEIGQIIADHMGYGGKLLPLAIGDDKGNAPVGLTPWSLPKPFVLDMSAAAVLGYTPAASYHELVGPYCDWLKESGSADWQTAFPVLASYPTAAIQLCGRGSLS